MPGYAAAVIEVTVALFVCVALATVSFDDAAIPFTRNRVRPAAPRPAHGRPPVVAAAITPLEAEGDANGEPAAPTPASAAGKEAHFCAVDVSASTNKLCTTCVHGVHRCHTNLACVAFRATGVYYLEAGPGQCMDAEGKLHDSMSVPPAPSRSSIHARAHTAFTLSLFP